MEESGFGPFVKRNAERRLQLRHVSQLLELFLAEDQGARKEAHIGSVGNGITR